MQHNRKDRRKSFLLGRWLVQPDLNRVSDDGEAVQVEPRVMDLLLFLANHAGEVVSRRDIINAVWQQDFVGDTTLSSAIAVLRRALDDDARAPRFIETIAKRGYRLVAEVVDPDLIASVTPFPGLVALQERSPYPGLAAFDEADAEHFFGRGQEAIALWDKITRQKLLAVIGPSGVGKSSFVRAGIIPTAPKGWNTIAFEPGEAPFNSLARALVPKFASDRGAVQQLLACNDPDVALALVSRWRERSSEALLIIDQFEELFTLNPTDVQLRFAGLLSRLAHAAHVHIVVVMRDDFLYDCHSHPGLAEVYKDLTVLKPLAAKNLQRAMIEPALRAGYRFEDEALAGEMIAEVSCERGATPMLAFALSRMWELRDRERKLITRQAHDEIGGVAGALAQHAEQVMEKIGGDHQPMVREIFRNLVTGHGTRVVREIGELLSVFPDDQQIAATEVLYELVSGRLLTTFEIQSTADEPASKRHRVEIVHESQLTAWPRLVRWQTQDAHAAQLRDQIRQAAKLWDEHHRSSDLLWAGSAFRELLVWQEHYPGGLSRVEGAFFKAMVSHAGRRRRHRRVVAAVLFLAVVAVAAIVTTLWRKSVHQMRRAEARQLFHLGQLAVDRLPGAALARAIASLELEDDPEVRHLALRALWKGPKGLIVRKGTAELEWPTTPDFSPDGRWLAAGYWSGEVALWPSSGGKPTVWQGHQTAALIWFVPDSSTLVSIGWNEPAYRFWSVPDGRLLGEQPIQDWLPATELNWTAIENHNRILRMVPSSGPGESRWRIDPRCEELLQWLNADDPRPGVVDSAGKIVAWGTDNSLFVARTDTFSESTPAPAAHHDQRFQQMAFGPDGSHIATVDAVGGVQLWSVVSGSSCLVRDWDPDTAERCTALTFDPSGSYLVAGFSDGLTRVWGIDDPGDSDPLRIVTDRIGVSGLSFDPSGRWLATASPGGVGLWPFDRARYGHVLHGHGGSVDDIAFAPDGSWLVSASADGTVRLWPLASTAGKRNRIIVDWGRSSSFVGLSSVAVAPDGNSVVVAIGGSDRVQVVSLDGKVMEELHLPPGDVHALAFSLHGKKVAVGCVAPAKGGSAGISVSPLLLVWNLETGEVTKIDFSPLGGTFQGLAFADDGAVLAASSNGLFRWDLDTIEPELLLEGIETFAVCRGQNKLVGANSESGGWTAAVHDLATGTTRPLATHGRIGDTLNVGTILAMDHICAVVATVQDREVRIGPATGEAPHVLLGHEDSIHAVAVSPDGHWIASGSRDNTIRLWPVPDLTRPPLHTLPRGELLDRLRGLTLARWVRNEDAPDSYAFSHGPFPGWETVPDW